MTTKISGEQKVPKLSPSPPPQPTRQTAALPILTLRLRAVGNGQFVNLRDNQMSRENDQLVPKEKVIYLT
jgi:hypothetical protein